MSKVFPKYLRTFPSLSSIKIKIWKCLTKQKGSIQKSVAAKSEHKKICLCWWCPMDLVFTCTELSCLEWIKICLLFLSLSSSSPVCIPPINGRHSVLKNVLVFGSDAINCVFVWLGCSLYCLCSIIVNVFVWIQKKERKKSVLHLNTGLIFKVTKQNSGEVLQTARS